jgi:hypothetical protein
VARLFARRGTRKEVAEALDNYWKHYSRLDQVRTCDFHSDGELAGFFFFHNTYNSIVAFKALEQDRQEPHRKRFLEEIVRLPEIDGAFVDSHELGKAYATGMALLCLSKLRQEK